MMIKIVFILLLLFILYTNAKFSFQPLNNDNNKILNFKFSDFLPKTINEKLLTSTNIKIAKDIDRKKGNNNDVDYAFDSIGKKCTNALISLLVSPCAVYYSDYDYDYDYSTLLPFSLAQLENFFCTEENKCVDTIVDLLYTCQKDFTLSDDEIKSKNYIFIYLYTIKLIIK